MTTDSTIPAPCQYDAGEIVRGTPSGVMFNGYTAAAEATPKLDNGYRFTGWQSDMVVWWLNYPDIPLYIFGPAGCGKTSGLKQIAARINYPVYEVTGYDSMQPVDLEGCQSLTAENGVTETAWLLGPLAKAMQEGGLFIFNEMDMASPSSLVALNTVLDGSPLVLEQTGQVIKPAPGFMFAATGNSNGSGDNSGAYTGVMRQNFALQDRFVAIEAGYMSRQAELALMMHGANARPYNPQVRVPGWKQRIRPPLMPQTVYEQMLEFATIVRAAAQSQAPQDFAQYNDFILPMSTRALLRWVEIAEVYAPAAASGVNVLEKSLMLAFGNTKDRGQVNAYTEILQRITGNG